MTAEGLPSFDGIGPIGDHLHSAREFIVIPTLATRAQIVALSLYRIAAAEIALR